MAAFFQPGWIATLGSAERAAVALALVPADVAGGGSGEEISGWCPMNCEASYAQAFRNGRRSVGSPRHDAGHRVRGMRRPSRVVACTPVLVLVGWPLSINLGVFRSMASLPLLIYTTNRARRLPARLTLIIVVKPQHNLPRR